MDVKTKTGQQSWQALLNGINRLTDCVAMTLGPAGRNIVVENTKWYYPTTTNDGATILQSIELPNPFENMGCKLLQQIADNTDEMVGDGTTTSAILARSMFREAFGFLTAHCDVEKLLSGMRQAVDFAIDFWQNQAVPVQTLEQLEMIATISGGSKQIGALIRQAYERVGLQGIIQVELGEKQETVLSFTEGIQLNKGYISPEMAYQMAEACADLKEPYILLTNDRISYIYEIFEILEKIVETGHPLLIIAEDISVELLKLLLQNHIKGTMDVVVVASVGYGVRRREYLEDIAVITGATVVAAAENMRLEEATAAVLGKADRVIVNQNTTTIIGGHGDPKVIQSYADELANEIAGLGEGWTKEKKVERLGWLRGGIAKIIVGGATEFEAKEQFYRFEDAFNSSRTAIHTGILPGGGIAYWQAAQALTELPTTSLEEQWGVDIIQQALKQPLLQLAQNAGEDGEKILTELKNYPKNYGYDVISGSYQDMLKAGILDAAGISISALTNAFSIVSLILDTGGLITYDI